MSYIVDEVNKLTYEGEISKLQQSPIEVIIRESNQPKECLRVTYISNKDNIDSVHIEEILGNDKPGDMISLFFDGSMVGEEEHKGKSLESSKVVSNGNGDVFVTTPLGESGNTAGILFNNQDEVHVYELTGDETRQSLKCSHYIPEQVIVPDDEVTL
ncbi:MAG TPA: hypothetical protein DEP72_00920 [Clostridiales bacterium]|nr:MAG: hypothetical protein A2Y18_05015 [Clostridiales bacterium GWD2_32_19]HCC06715.1 hypothetical protein [Clostridiales bacterium]